MEEGDGPAAGCHGRRAAGERGSVAQPAQPWLSRATRVISRCQRQRWWRTCRRKQRQALDLADQLAIHPFEVGDYRSEDAAGHTLENLLIDDFIFTYWVDHAVTGVQITEVIKV